MGGLGALFGELSPQPPIAMGLHQGCSGVGTRGNGVPIPFLCGNAFPYLFALVAVLEDVGSKRLH